MAFDAFMELFKGNKVAVTGETLDKKFADKKAFELRSFKLNSQRDMTQGHEVDPGDEEGQAEPVFVLNIQKDIDSATPDLFLNYCRYATMRGQDKQQSGVFDIAIVTVRKAGGIRSEGGKAVTGQIEYLVYEFHNVYIKSWKLEESGSGDELPEEVVDFCFNYCQMQYYPQKKTGEQASAVEGFWDFADLANNNAGS
jgi:type VI protein secretion system component Hcp